MNKIILEADEESVCCGIRDCQDSAVCKGAFRWKITWWEGVGCVPDPTAIEKQSDNFLGIWRPYPIRKETADGNGSAAVIGDICAQLIGIRIRQRAHGYV